MNPTRHQPKPPPSLGLLDIVLNARRSARADSAFLTPWGIKECRRLPLPDIESTFGPAAAAFWREARAGRILGAPK